MEGVCVCESVVPLNHDDDRCCVQCSQENPAQLPTEGGLAHSVGLSSNFVWS